MAPDFVRYNPQDSHVRSVRHDPCGFFFRVMHPNIAFLCEDNKRAKCKHTQNTSRYLLSALSSERICPPSSRVSPFCLRQSPTGRATLGSRTLSGVASLCHSLRWCKKSQRTRNFVLSSGVRRSLPRRRCSSRSVFEKVSAFIRTRRTSKVHSSSHHNCERSEQYHLP